MANNWQLVGLVLALELIFAGLVAVWTRWAYNAKIQHQTIWHVVVGVSGVVVISGLQIGLENAGFLLACFSMAFIPMAIEYFGRLEREEEEAQKVREESIDVDASADREE